MAIKKTSGVKAKAQPDLKLQIEYLPITDLIPDRKNSRIHTDEQIDAVAKSIKEMGFLNPVLIDDGKNIIAGHARVLAAFKAGLSDVPTINLKHLNKTQHRAYLIMDNQLAINGAGWNLDILKTEISDLEFEGFDLSLLNFEAGFLDEMITSMDSTEAEEAASNSGLTPPAICKPGDVWILGLHLLRVENQEDCHALDRAIQTFQTISGKVAKLEESNESFFLTKKKRLSNDVSK